MEASAATGRTLVAAL